MAEARQDSWREKYLSLVEQQEQQEQAVAEQLEQLRRTLVRVSLAADGLDPELDQVLAALREHLKSSRQYHLNERLAVVEEAVLAYDERKSQRHVQLVWAVEALCGQLQELPLARSHNSQLKKLKSGLKKRLESFQEIPKLLRELSQIQAQALQSLNIKKPNLLEKFSGLAGKSKPEAEKEDASHQVIDGSYDRAPADDGDAETDNDAVFRESELHGQVLDTTTIAQGVGDAVRQLLDHIEPAECVEEKIRNARARIHRGLTWHDLIPTLEDVRDLIVQSHRAANDDFSHYLEEVNRELNSICSSLAAAAEEVKAEQQRQNQTQESVDVQIKAIETSVSTATDLDGLKNEVTQHIQHIRDALVKPVEKKVSLTEQIKELLNQVESLEQEAQRTHASLSEQKEKALHDTLTGLPNREAYVERSHLEYTRWSRYQNPLTLAVIDIDHFKQVNDRFGHQAGDKVLKLVANGLQKRLREVDFICRYGGEEFVLLLPETASNNALPMLNKVREIVAQTPFHFKQEPVKITVSIGASEFSEGDTVDTVFGRADKALYRAKANGRNLCELAE